MARWSIVLVIAIVALCGVAIGVMGVGAAEQPVYSDQLDATEAAGPEEPEVWLRVQLTATGDGEWAIEHRFNVTTDAQEEAFLDLVEAVHQGDVDPGYDRTVIESYRDDVAEEIEREMSIEEVEWTDRLEDNTGVLTFEFVWTNFAIEDNDRLILGDAFETPSGTWLSQLDENTWLTISAPEGYAVDSSPPDRGVVNGDITWRGPTQFEPGYISVTYVPVDVTPPLPPENGVAIGGTNHAVIVDDDSSLLPLVGLGIIGVLIALVLAVGGHRHLTASSTTTEPEQTAANGQANGGAETDKVNVELLSDEERVEQLLDDHGGRMKQAAIVEATGWSNAKVSQLLSSMAEENRIDKLRLGRENVISLASPVEEEDQ